MFGTFPRGRRSPGLVFVRMAAATLHYLAPELDADAVLRVVAVDLEPHPRAGVDVPPAALEEEREPTEAALHDVSRRPRIVRRGDRGAWAHRDRVARVAEDDRNRIAVEVVDADHAHRGDRSGAPEPRPARRGRRASRVGRHRSLLSPQPQPIRAGCSRDTASTLDLDQPTGSASAR